MFENLPRKVYCSKCNTQTNHGILERVTVGSSDPDEYAWYEYYFIAKCAGCDQINFVKIYTDEDMHATSYSDYDYYNLTEFPEQPPLNASKFEIKHEKREFLNVPDTIEDVYNEVCDAFNGKLYYLSTMGLRMMVESICIDLEIQQGTVLNDEFTEPKLNKKGNPIINSELHGKIFGLYENRYITMPQLQVLIRIKNFGNKAAHEIKRPSKLLIKDMIKIIEDLLHMHYDLKDVLPN